MNISQIEQRPRMMDRQQHPIADSDVANIEIPPPLPLSVETRGHLPIRGDTQCSDEGGDRPRNPVVEVQRPVAMGTTRPGSVFEDLRRVLGGQFRIPGRLPEWPPLGTDGDPRIVVHQNVFDRNDQHVSPRGSFNEDRPANRIRLCRDAIKARTIAGNRLVGGCLKVSSTGVERFDLETLARPDPQQRFIAGVKGVFSGEVAGDALHGGYSGGRDWQGRSAQIMIPRPRNEKSADSRRSPAAVPAAPPSIEELLTMPHEFDLIDRLRRATPANVRVPVGIGDDAAVLDWSVNPRCLVTVDMLMEGVDFTRDSATPEQIGRKSLAVNLSDIAAMAGKPVACVVAVSLPRDGGFELGQRLHTGLAALANEFGVAIAGGDTNTWDGPLVLSITVLGEPTGRGPVLRSGAKPGDWVFVTGELGGSILGHHLDFTP
ncbi:MAG: thiamine-phosphate kinase, partial [Planctomycetota bacterium]|nr:thiamine-phosphate kinase [Planctomycetota bacterium]